MDSTKKDQIIEAISNVMHPAIDLSLTQLGIVKEIKFDDNIVNVLFAFPFPNIPIAEHLISSVKEVVVAHDAEYTYQTVIMTEEERQKFLQLEASAWRGL